MASSANFKLPQKTNWYQGKKIVIMGLGLHGGALGNARWLHDVGAQLLITDLKTEAELAPSKQALADLEQVVWVLGKHRVDDFTSADLILQNPGVPRDSQYLQQAEQAGVPIVMDANLFLQHNPASTLIGVTGSKGKSTTTQAIAHVLAAVFPQTHTVGVEGTAPLATLPQIEPVDGVAFELSSWRLEALGKFKQSPPIAVVTSLYRDHLNTYASWDEYVAAKQNIVNYQNEAGLALLNFDDQKVREWASQVPGLIWWYSRQEKPPGDGIWCEQGKIKAQTGKRHETIASVSDLPSLGKHQQRNLLPGLLLAWHFGASTRQLKNKLASFISLPGRFELVATVNDVKYINDTTATIPEATQAALKAAQPQKTILILGGSDKELDFTELAQYIAQAKHLRQIIFLPGSATESMAQAITQAYAKIPTSQTETMSEAVTQAASLAQPGDLVLLSPGATSFGLFTHEFARGEAFQQAVKEIKED